jgi:cob(I)alamin adenosyltransferase
VLHEVKMQQSQTQKELEEITSRLYNAKQELGSSENTSVLTNKEKEFIEKEIAKKPETKSIIEAASAVAASLKSKLNKTEKELEAIQQLLEKERQEHEITKEKLEELQKSKSNKS